MENFKKFDEFVSENNSSIEGLDETTKTVMKQMDAFHSLSLKLQQMKKKFVASSKEDKEKMKQDLIDLTKKVKKAEIEFEKELNKEPDNYDILMEFSELNESKNPISSIKKCLDLMDKIPSQDKEIESLIQSAYGKLSSAIRKIEARK